MNAIDTGILAVLNSLWMAAAATLVAGLALHLIPRVNAATRYAVWWVVLAVVVALPAAVALGSRQQNAPAAAPTTAQPQVHRAAAEPRRVSRPVASASAGVVTVRIQPAAQAVDPSGSSVRLVQFHPLELRADKWPSWILALWSVVFLIQAARILASYRYLRGVKRRTTAPSTERLLQFHRWLAACGIRRPVRLLMSSEIASPMAVGFFAPAVILPGALTEQLDPAGLDHVLLHELAHVARYDDWTNLAGRFCSAILQLHPVAVWILSRIEREREMACDDWVVAHTGTARPYAASLARLFELCLARRRDLLATGLALGGRSSQLRQRIERLVRRRGSAPATTNVLMSRVVPCALALMLIVAAGPRAPHWIAFAQAAPQSTGPISGVIQGVPGGVAGGTIGGIAGSISGGIAGGISGAVAAPRITNGISSTIASVPSGVAGGVPSLAASTTIVSSPVSGAISGGVPQQLSTPAQVAPAAGAELHEYPREVVFDWSAVMGAESYVLEVDCMDCCVKGKWCSESDQHLISTYRDLQTTSFTVEFPGDQRGRWRVSAVAGLLTSDKSSWREFSFNTAAAMAPAARAPVPLSPVANALIDGAAGKISFTWQAVPGATSYMLELDIFGTCLADKWCTEVGKRWIEADIKDTKVSVDLPKGDRLRWRVSGVAGARKTLSSQWSELSVRGPEPHMAAPTVAASASPQMVDGSPVYRVGNGVTPPVPTYRIEPSYPQQANQDHVTGTVLVHVIVAADGSVRNATIQKGVRDDLDRAALDAVGKWHFKPAMKDGQAVAVWSTIEVTFNLK
jgi:TonB family protein